MARGRPTSCEQAQHSLIPPSLPLLPDIRLSGSYHRASSSRSAGGDWYDAVPLGEGQLALVIGDAVGHGVAAAGAMSRLRGAMRSTALRNPAPLDVLTALDAFAGQMDDVEGASVFYGVLDAATGRLTYTAAGHPAPLVVHADGSTSFLPVVPRPPLGSLPGIDSPVAHTVLEQGATLVLFSNGALAGAGEGTPLERLADVSRKVLARPSAFEAEGAAGLAAAIAEGVRQPPEGWPDDVAVLVAHRRSSGVEPLRMELQAVPAALPGVRRRLGSWLAGLGMGEQDRVGVMVAVGEACANAAEHAYRGTEPGPLAVVADVDVDGVLTVIVTDQGTWRPPDRDPGDRGRGLLIMRQLVDTVVLQEERGTTLTLSLRLRRSVEEDPERAAGPAGAVVAVERAGDAAGRAGERRRRRGRGRAAADPDARGQPRRHRAHRAGRHRRRPVQQRRRPRGADDRPHRPRRGVAAGGARSRGRGDPARAGDQRPERPRRPPLTLRPGDIDPERVCSPRRMPIEPG